MMLLLNFSLTKYGSEPYQTELKYKSQDNVHLFWPLLGSKETAKLLKLVVKMANEAVLIFALYKLSDFPAALFGFWPSEFNENKNHMMQCWAHFLPQVAKSRCPPQMILPFSITGKHLTKAHWGHTQTENILAKSNSQLCFAQIFTLKLIRRAIQTI